MQNSKRHNESYFMKSSNRRSSMKISKKYQSTGILHIQILFLLCAIFMSINTANATKDNSLQNSEAGISIYSYENLDTIDNNLDAMVGQMLMLGINGQDISQDIVMKNALSKGIVGGIILFYPKAKQTPYNLASPKQIKTFIEQIKSTSKYPLFISVDQEGGRVQGLRSKNGFRDWPSAQELGEGNTDQTYSEVSDMAQVLAQIGFNVDLAPVVDTLSPLSPAIGARGRAFHANPQIINAHAEAFTRALQKFNIIPALKHFPGHGSAQKDSHLGFTDISQTWTSEELIPYQYFIDQDFQGMIMTAHVYHEEFDNKPATLSYNIITKLLRKKMGFDGVVISDDMQMDAISKQYSLEETILLSIQAGVDILIFANNLKFDPQLGNRIHAHIMQLVKEGKISKERIEESWQRIRKMKEQYLL